MSRVFRASAAAMMAVKAAPVAPAAAAAPAAAKLNPLLKPQPVTPAFSKFLGGASEVSRADAIKKIWDYIKLNNLQNPANKREIRCDEKLKSIFPGKDNVGMFQMARLITPLFVK